jgi:hypothetical protein
MEVKYSLFLIADDNSARCGGLCLLFSFLSILRNVKILYLDIYELLMVNYVAVTAKT